MKRGYLRMAFYNLNPISCLPCGVKRCFGGPNLSLGCLLYNMEFVGNYRARLNQLKLDVLASGSVWPLSEVEYVRVGEQSWKACVKVAETTLFGDLSCQQCASNILPSKAEAFEQVAQCLVSYYTPDVTSLSAVAAAFKSVYPKGVPSRVMGKLTNALPELRGSPSPLVRLKTYVPRNTYVGTSFFEATGLDAPKLSEWKLVCPLCTGPSLEFDDHHLYARHLCHAHKPKFGLVKQVFLRAIALVRYEHPNGMSFDDMLVATGLSQEELLAELGTSFHQDTPRYFLYSVPTEGGSIRWVVSTYTRQDVDRDVALPVL